MPLRASSLRSRIACSGEMKCRKLIRRRGATLRPESSSGPKVSLRERLSITSAGKFGDLLLGHVQRTLGPMITAVG